MMSGLLLGFIAIAACSCFYMLRSGKPEFRNITWILYSLLFGAACYLVISKIIFSFTDPQVWDFPAFYLYGKVAAMGHDFYLPADYQAVFSSVHIPVADTSPLVDEVVNVGFPYPPPTILYLAPLGMLSYETAFAVWSIFIMTFLVGSIYLIYQLFLKEYKLNGLMLAVILTFSFAPVGLTIFYSQTNFILLFFLLLMKKYEDKPYAGIFLALAIFTKPFMAVFLMYFLLRKNWKAILYFIGTAIAVVGLTAAIFGVAPFLSYFHENPASRLPKINFVEHINQSLHAVLLRANLISLDNSKPYIAIAGVAGLASLGYLYYLIKRKLYDHIWAFLLLMGLIFYPGTLSYYGTLLLFILFQFFNEKRQFGMNPYFTIPVVGIVFFLCKFSVFGAVVFLLALTILKSIRPALIGGVRPLAAAAR